VLLSLIADNLVHAGAALLERETGDGTPDRAPCYPPAKHKRFNALLTGVVDFPAWWTPR
jgi:hypothetical protein